MPDTDTSDAPATGADDTDTPDTLGDAGKKALEAERAARREAERKLKEIEDRDKSELQKLQDAVKERDGQLAQLPAQVRKQAIRFASQATQAGFLDPEDALLNIDVDLGDDAAVKAALEELAQRKPHLVRRDTPKVPKRPKPPSGQSDESDDDSLKGKERAAAALRQFSRSK